MGQIIMLHPGWASLEYFPQLSITPTSAVEIVKKQGKHIVVAKEAKNEKVELTGCSHCWPPNHCGEPSSL
jgi:hypothetical protein